MWNWFNCYLSGRHEYGVWCEPGTIFLRCTHCGRRSSGWSLNRTADVDNGRHEHIVKPTLPAAAAGRVLPFGQQVAR